MRSNNRSQKWRPLLTPRELDVLKLGFLSAYQTSHALGIGAGTVTNYRTRIIDKLRALGQGDVSSFDGAVELGLQLAFITVEDVATAYLAFLRKVSGESQCGDASLSHMPMGR